MNPWIFVRAVMFAGGGWQGVLTFVFVVWATVGLFVNFFQIELPPLLGWADAFFLTLAAVLVFLAVAGRDGYAVTVRNFSVVAVSTSVLETVGTLTGVPFGQYYYSDRVGWKIGGILPYTIPLAWWSIVAGGHYILGGVFRRIHWRSRFLLGLAVGLWALGHDLLLEPFAWHVRGYWWWDAPGVPLQNYVTWFVTSFFLTLIFPTNDRVANARDPRPIIVAIYMVLTFLLGIAGYALHNS